MIGSSQVTMRPNENGSTVSSSEDPHAILYSYPNPFVSGSKKPDYVSQTCRVIGNRMDLEIIFNNKVLCRPFYIRMDTH